MKAVRSAFPFLLFTTSLLVLLPGTGSLNILRQGDEVMHIATVRESLSQNSWMIPLLTGSPNAYKPPLLFWMGMIGEKLFGESVFADRFPVAVLGAGSVVVLYSILQLFRVGLVRSATFSLLYLFTLGTFKFSRLLMMDQPMAFFLLVFAFFYLLHFRQRRLTWLFLAGIVTGTAFLFKGPLFHIYTALIFASGATMRLWRPNVLANPRRLKRIVAALSGEGMVFLASALMVPTAWIGFLAARGRGDILWFFFIVENAGKFAAVNQSPAVIFEGWMLYALPWTAGLFLIFFHSWSGAVTKGLSGSQLIASRILMGAVTLMTLLHLLPDRKDPYYVLPALPLLGIGAALYLRHVELSRADGRVPLLSNASLALVFQNAILSFLLAAGVMVIQGPVLLSVALIVVALLSAPSFYLFRKKKHMPFLWVLALSQGVVFLIVFQFMFLPAIARPLFSAQAIGMIRGKDVCLISDNWWDVFELRLVMPESNVAHSSPDSPVNCADGVRPVLELEHDRAFDRYHEAARWTHWSTKQRPVSFERDRRSLPASLEGESRLLLPEMSTVMPGGVK